MAISLASEEGTVTIGSEILLHNGFSGRKTPLYTVGGATFLRSGSISVGDDALYPEAYSKFAWPGQYWTQVSGQFTTGTPYYDLVFAFGKWFAGGSSGVIKTSVDGITWTLVANTPGGTVAQFCLVGTLLVVATTNGIYTTTDGVTWTQRSSVGCSTLKYGQGKFFAGVAATATNYITSTDGITWSSVTTVTGATFNGTVAFGNNIWISAGSGGVYYTSPDAVTWTTRNMSTDTGAVSVFFGAGAFTMLTQNSSSQFSPRFCYKSVDGISWGVGAALPFSVGAYASRVGNVKVDPKGAVFIGLAGYSGSPMSVVTSIDAKKFIPRFTVASTDIITVVGLNDTIALAISNTGLLFYSQRSIGIPAEDTVGSAIRYMRIK